MKTRRMSEPRDQLYPNEIVDLSRTKAEAAPVVLAGATFSFWAFPRLDHRLFCLVVLCCCSYSVA